MSYRRTKELVATNQSVWSIDGALIPREENAGDSLTEGKVEMKTTSNQSRHVETPVRCVSTSP